MQVSISVEKVKIQAKALREYLESGGSSISHSIALEALSKMYGFKDWNTACAVLRKHGEAQIRAASDGYGIVEADSCPATVYISDQLIDAFGWQQIGDSIKIPGKSSGILEVNFNVTPYFEAKAVQFAGYKSDQPSESRRFMINSVTVGGSPQLAIHYPNASDDVVGGLISDVFSNKSLVHWSVFSTSILNLERELKIHIFNMNEESIVASINIWGNAVSDLMVYGLG